MKNEERGIKRTTIKFKIASIIVLFGVVAVFAIWIYPMLTYTKLTVPEGAHVTYAQGSKDECDFVYESPNTLHILPRLSVKVAPIVVEEGATHNLGNIEIKIIEVHPDYLVILVRRVYH